MRAKLFLFVVVLCIASSALAQVPGGCFITRRALPDDLRSSLEARLSAFLAAQADEHWDTLAEYIGGAYSASHEQCLISRMQEIRMLSFEFSIHDLSICTTASSKSDVGSTVNRLMAEQASWYLRGAARFRTSSREWVEQTDVVAYRKQGQWYFNPPQSKMQDEWEKAHYTEVDFTRDRQDEIEIRNDPSSAIEIKDVHVFMNRKYPSLRNVKFKLQNRSPKKVTAVGMTIGDGRGSASLAISYEIEPNSYFEYEETIAAYGDFCDGISKNEMTIKRVYFEDGTKWELNDAGGDQQDKSSQNP